MIAMIFSHLKLREKSAIVGSELSKETLPTVSLLTKTYFNFDVNIKFVELKHRQVFVN